MPRGPDIQAYRRLRFGGLADFHVLDTRQHRSDQACGDTNGPLCAEALEPGRTMLGAEQEGWLFDGLAASEARWNVLANQVMIARLEGSRDGEPTVSMDRWDGYPEAQGRLLSFLDQARPANPVVLTGDIHSNWAADLKADPRDPASSVVGAELVGTSISSGGDGEDTRPGTADTLARNPHIHFFKRPAGLRALRGDPRSPHRRLSGRALRDAPGSPGRDARLLRGRSRPAGTPAGVTRSAPVARRPRPRERSRPWAPRAPRTVGVGLSRPCARGRNRVTMIARVRADPRVAVAILPKEFAMRTSLVHSNIIATCAAVLALTVAAAPAAGQWTPMKPGSDNMDVLGHAPLGPQLSVADIELEQELHRPYAYVAPHGVWGSGPQGHRHHQPGGPRESGRHLPLAHREPGPAPAHRRHGRQVLQARRPLLRRAVPPVRTGRSQPRPGRGRAGRHRAARSHHGARGGAHPRAGAAGGLPQHLHLQAFRWPGAASGHRAGSLRPRLRHGEGRRRRPLRRPGGAHSGPRIAARTGWRTWLSRLLRRVSPGHRTGPLLRRRNRGLLRPTTSAIWTARSSWSP